MEEELKDIYKDMMFNFDKLQKVNEALINQIPNEFQKEKFEMLEQMSKINTFVGEKDFNSLNKMLKNLEKNANYSNR